MRLRSILAAAFASLALVLTLTVALGVHHLSAGRVRERIGTEVADLAGHVRTLLDTDVSERWADMQVMAAVAVASGPSADHRAWLEALRKTYGAYAWIGFADAGGTVTASTGRLLEGASVAARPWFREGRSRPFVGDVHEAALLAALLPPAPDGTPLRFVDVAAPVRDAAGTLLGVVGGHLSWHWANEVTDAIVAPALARDARIDVLVLDQGGTVLLGPPGLRGKRLATHPGGGARSGDAAAPTQTYALETWEDGVDYVVGASRSTGIGAYPGLGWTILVRQPADAAFAPARRLGLEIAAIGSVLAAIFALVGWFAATIIAAPLLTLAEAASGSNGDSDLRLPAPRGCTEVRTLTRALETLRARIAERKAALAAANADLERQVQSRTRELEWARDAAEQAQARAEAASRAKSEFVATMSHEIRTPLSGVVGFIDLLAADPALGPTQRRHAEAAAASGSALRTIVDDVLDFAKIEAGHLRLDVVPFPLERLVTGALDVVRIGAEAKGLRLEAAIDPALTGWWRGDEDRLRQILVNLLGNAVKFTAAGRVALAVRPVPPATPSDGPAEGASRLHFSVADTGLGIATDQQAGLFDPFTQASDTVARRFGGTGLGLAICKRLVAVMGGEIGLDSAPGRGSTFWFAVDLPVAADAAPRTPAALAVVAPSGAPVARLLLVDDLALNRDLAKAVLERAGYAVDTAASGEEAVIRVGAEHFDLVLMDVQMPGMDGLAATRAIRALPGRAGLIPVVALSANVLPEQVRLYRAAGMNGHVGKPFVWAELYGAVAEQLVEGPARAAASA